MIQLAPMKIIELNKVYYYDWLILKHIASKIQYTESTVRKKGVTEFLKSLKISQNNDIINITIHNWKPGTEWYNKMKKRTMITAPIALKFLISSHSRYSDVIERASAYRNVHQLLRCIFEFQKLNIDENTIHDFVVPSDLTHETTILNHFLNEDHETTTTSHNDINTTENANKSPRESTETVPFAKRMREDYDNSTIEQFLSGPEFLEREDEINTYEFFKLSHPGDNTLTKNCGIRGFGRKPIDQLTPSNAKSRCRQFLSGFAKICELAGQKFEDILKYWFDSRTDHFLVFVKSFIACPRNLSDLQREVELKKGKNVSAGLPRADFLAYVTQRLNISMKAYSEFRLWSGLSSILYPLDHLKEYITEYNIM